MEAISAAIGTMLLAAFAAAALDQCSKALVTARLADGRVYGWRHIGLRRVQNRRPGVLALSGSAAVTLWAAVLAGTMAALALLPPQSAALVAGIGLSLGGATGNLIDRLARGAVVDFIVVGRWPTFNLADAALVAGVGLVAVSFS